MKNTKTTFMTFLPYDYQGIEEELKKQSQEGWHLTGIKKNTWTFQKCEPNQYRYCVTYVPDASIYNPEPTKHEITLDEFCEETGWIKAAESNYLQIYATEKEDILPIDTDEELKFQYIKKSIRKHYLPGKLLISALDFSFLFLLFYAFRNQATLSGTPLLVTAEKHFSDLLLFSGLFFFGPAPLINYWIWTLRTNHSLKTRGRPANTKPHSIADTILGILLMIFICFNLYYSIKGPQELTDFINTLFFTILIGPYSYMLSRIMKKAGFSKKVNMILSFLIAILFSLFTAPFFTACLIARGVLIP